MDSGVTDRGVTDRPRMSREQYRRWREGVPRGRYELIHGEVVAMAPERWVHARLKFNIVRAFAAEIERLALPFQAMTDGMTVEVDADTDYEPDALINRGQTLADDSIAAPEPVVVVEVLSPSTSQSDVGGKLADYFRVPSIVHYLIVRPDRPEIVHVQRAADGRIVMDVVTSGSIRLEPPGIELSGADVFRAQ